jgi:hypothetical protein
MRESVLITLSALVAVPVLTNEDAAGTTWGIYFRLTAPTIWLSCASRRKSYSVPAYATTRLDGSPNLALTRVLDCPACSKRYIGKEENRDDVRKGRRDVGRPSKLIATSSQILFDMLQLICIHGLRIAAAAKIAFAVLPTNSLAVVRLPAATASVTPGNVTGA